MNKTIPFWAPKIVGPEYHLIKQVLDSCYLNDGNITDKFEQEIAKLIGAKYAVATTSGTTALFLALVAMGAGVGDEVIVPDVTFIATANAVTLTGAKPVLVDIDAKTLNIDPQAIKKAITKKTKAIIPVHISGRSANMDSIIQIAKAYNLYVIEDSAEALMSKSGGKFLGTIGDAGCFSFSPNKTITTGQGGMVVTNDEQLYIRLKELKDQGRPVRGTGGSDEHNSIGYNFKFTNIQAAIGLGQLTELKDRIARQKQIYQIYESELKNLPGIEFPGFDIEGGEAPQWTDVLVEKCSELDSYLQKNNIYCRRFWHTIHTQKPYYQKDDFFVNSTKQMQKAIWLPSSFALSDEEVFLVCKLIKKFLTS